jgi:ActR/RegA family two-component response regulator
LQEIASKLFELLLCDLNIAGISDGFNVVRAMRSVNPNCVVVILTGFPGVESAIESIHHGVDDYIVKPSSADALVAVLAEKLAARQTAHAR